jgi:hypothetical protein
MSIIVLDIPLFRLQFPEFADSLTYPDVIIEQFWEEATCSVSNKNCGNLSGTCRQLVLNLMTAHLIKLNHMYSTGYIPYTRRIGAISSGKAGDVSVGYQLAPAPTSTQWYWSLTPYGQRLRTILAAKAIGLTVISPRR